MNDYLLLLLANQQDLDRVPTEVPHARNLLGCMSG